MPNLEKNEYVYVVGNLPELGAWNHNQAIQLPQELPNGDGNTGVFDDVNNGQRGDENEDISESAFGDRDEWALKTEKENQKINYIQQFIKPISVFSEAPVYSQTISLPIDVDVEFRYFVAAVCQPNGTKNSAKTLIVRKWETHMTPRVVKKNGELDYAVV